MTQQIIAPRQPRIDRQDRRVPNEYIGRARALREKVKQAGFDAAEQIDDLIGPMRLRSNFTPIPRHQALRQVAQEWERLPELGRLFHYADFTAGKLSLAECRLVASRLAFPGWEENELALTINLVSVTFQGTKLEEVFGPLACCGLHSIARYLQRKRPKYDSDVLVALCPVARRAADIAHVGGEFDVKGWIGSVGNHKVLAIRTYVQH